MTPNVGGATSLGAGPSWGGRNGSGLQARHRCCQNSSRVQLSGCLWIMLPLCVGEGEGVGPVSMLPAGAIAQRGELAPDLVDQGCKGRRQQHGCWGDNGCFATIRLRCCMLEDDTIAVQATLARSAAQDLEPRCQRPWGICGYTGRAACAEGSLPGVWAADSWLPRGNKRRCSRLAPRGSGLMSPGCSAVRGLPGGQQGRRPQHLYTAPFAKRKPCMARA